MSQKAQEFSLEVEEYAVENGVSHIYALTEFCDAKGIDYSQVTSYMTQSLHDKITLEAEDINLIEKSGKLMEC